jgi:hypothetical protein
VRGRPVDALLAWIGSLFGARAALLISRDVE